MDSGLKQRLIGAAVLVALAVIFLPMLVQGPAPDSGVADLSMQMPAEPEGGYETRDLPLVVPGATSSQGLLDEERQSLPTVDTANPASDAVGGGDTGAPATDPAATRAASVSPMLPPRVAGGDYAVNFGAYATRANADTVVARLQGQTLPAFTESASVSGRPAWRVRIGPYATRADAEIARLAAGQVGSGVDARVVALDARTSPEAVPASTSQALPPPAAPGTPAALPAGTSVAAKPLPSPAVAPSALATAPVVAADKPMPPVAPVATTTSAAGSGFAVQLGAFAKGDEANALRDRLRAAGINAFTDSVQTDGGTLTRVKAGPVLSRAEADQLKTRVRGRFGIDGLVRAHP
ncbi:MAG TPA: SPOR domain-containing protein [Luteimonas sp.]|nr:SPOR domain-containing protein [Luteimonas sp.]